MMNIVVDEEEDVVHVKKVVNQGNHEEEIKEKAEKKENRVEENVNIYNKLFTYYIYQKWLEKKIKIHNIYYKIQ